MYALKIFHNPWHFLHSELLNLFYPRRVKRGSLSVNSLYSSLMRFNTFQYSRRFIPAATKLWKDLPKHDCRGCRRLNLVLMPFYRVWMDHRLPYVPQFLNIFVSYGLLILVLPNSLLLLWFCCRFLFFLYFFLLGCLPCWGLQIFGIKLSHVGFTVRNVMIIS